MLCRAVKPETADVTIAVGLLMLAWQIFPRIARPMRTARIDRNTTETKIFVEVNLDGTGSYDISTGIGFLDHMVEQFSRHSLIDVTMKVEGDLHVDQHHTTEDSALALGQALSAAMGDKAGIGRYGTAYSPMDETLSRVALDISGRPYVVWNVFAAPEFSLDGKRWCMLLVGCVNYRGYYAREDAERLIDALPPAHRSHAIVVGSRGWHPGVVGIVASRLMRQYHKPTFIIAIDEDGVGKGSGRSIEGLSLVEAIRA